jgi:biotin carboxyl carrier protein
MKRFHITVNGTAYDVQVEEVAAGGAPAAVSAPAPAAAVAVAAPAPAAAPVAAPKVAAAAGATQVNSPMPGNILDIKVTAGQVVTKGQTLVILEAMKMENEIPAPADGTVAGIHVAKGESVDTGALLVSLS